MTEPESSFEILYISSLYFDPISLVTGVFISTSATFIVKSFANKKSIIAFLHQVRYIFRAETITGQGLVVPHQSRKRYIFPPLLLIPLPPTYALS